MKADTVTATLTHDEVQRIITGLEEQLAAARAERDTWHTRYSVAAERLIHAKAEAARLRDFYEAWQRCESGRGCYSCTEAHDCRCPKDRGLGECACGRDRLMAAEAALEER